MIPRLCCGCRWREPLTPRQRLLRDERIAVVNLVKRLCRNNPHPFAQFDWKFRLIVVRSCVKAYRMTGKLFRPKESEGEALRVPLTDPTKQE